MPAYSTMLICSVLSPATSIRSLNNNTPSRLYSSLNITCGVSNLYSIFSWSLTGLDKSRYLLSIQYFLSLLIFSSRSLCFYLSFVTFYPSLIVHIIHWVIVIVWFHFDLYLFSYSHHREYHANS